MKPPFEPGEKNPGGHSPFGEERSNQHARVYDDPEHLPPGSVELFVGQAECLILPQGAPTPDCLDDAEPEILPDGILEYLVFLPARAHRHDFSGLQQVLFHVDCCFLPGHINIMTEILFSVKGRLLNVNFSSNGGVAWTQPVLLDHATERLGVCE